MIWLALALFLSGALLILLKPLLDGNVHGTSMSQASWFKPKAGNSMPLGQTALRVIGSMAAIAVIIALAIWSDFSATPKTEQPQLFLPPMPAAQQQLPDVDTMVMRLAERLKKNPDDVRGWKMLGWSYLHLDRPDDAVKAYERAAALEPSDAEAQASLAEALIRTHGGKIPARARKSILAALAIEPKQPRATFLLGRWHIQNQNAHEAWKLWSTLRSSGTVPEDWRLELDRELTTLAPLVGQAPPSPMEPTPQPPAFSASGTRPGPDAETIKAAEDMSPDARARMVDGMVAGLAERLKANPKNLEGWLMLAKSRMVLGDRNAARTAIMRAREEFSADSAAQARISAFTREIGLSP